MVTTIIKRFPLLQLWRFDPKLWTFTFLSWQLSLTFAERKNGRICPIHCMKVALSFFKALRYKSCAESSDIYIESSDTCNESSDTCWEQASKLETPKCSSGSQMSSSSPFSRDNDLLRSGARWRRESPLGCGAKRPLTQTIPIATFSGCPILTIFVRKLKSETTF